jgi:hypothetical protein
MAKYKKAPAIRKVLPKDERRFATYPDMFPIMSREQMNELVKALKAELEVKGYPKLKHNE